MTALGTSADNVTVGPSHLYIAPYGSTLPTYAEISDLLGGTQADFVNVGETTAAVSVTDTPTFVKATSQQQARTIAAAVSEITTTIKTTILEITEANLVNAIRATVSPGLLAVGDTLTPGGIGPVNVFSLAVVGPYAGGANCLLVAERVYYDAAQAFDFDKTKYTDIAVEFEVLTPSSSGLTGGWALYVPGTTPAS